MPKLSTFILTIFTITFLSVFITSDINAEAGGISISPPNIRISAGKSYKITITNTTTETYSASIVPSLFKLEEEGSVRPLNDVEVTELAIVLSEFISFDVEKITLDAGSTQDVLVTYKKSLPDYFVGLTVNSSGGGSGNVSISTGLSSYIIDFDIEEVDVQKILNPKVDIEPSVKLLGTGIGNIYEITLSFSNESLNDIISSGEVYISIIKDKKIKIDQFTITPQLINGIKPGEQITIVKEFKDERGVFNRKGDLEVLLTLDVEGTQIAISDTANASIAMEHIFIVAFVISIGLSIGFFFSRQKSKLNLARKT